MNLETRRLLKEDPILIVDDERMSISQGLTP
jgi:hypothetical protein